MTERLVTNTLQNNFKAVSEETALKLFLNMYVKLIEGDFDSCLVEGFLHLLLNVKVNVPVISGIDPGAKDENE